MKLIYLSESLRIFCRSHYVKKHGFNHYKGSPESIAKQIIDSCWNRERTYFQASAGHFSQFYSRDFGMCAGSLVKLGYRKKVLLSLDYALSRFEKHGRITTSISPGGVCFDFPDYGADSLPFIMRAIRESDGREILKKYDGFLKSEIDFYFRNVFDRKTSLVRSDRHFSSIKDYSMRRSSCYDNCVLSMLKDDLSFLGFHNPFAKHDVKQEIMSNFWNGHYFYEDISKKNIVTGDANTFPFWCDVTESKDFFRRCMQSVEEAGLTKPFPLRYTAERRRIHQVHFLEFLAGDYERDTVWMHLGLCFLDVVKKYDKKRFRRFMNQYDCLIKRHRNFLEVYDRRGKPFQNMFYYSDESMSWVSKYLFLKRS